MFVQFVVLFACGWITNGQYEEVDNISIRATKIVSDNEFITQEPFYIAVFPSLQFTCETGYVVRLWFIGRQYEQSPLGPQFPSFRLFSSIRQPFSNGSILNRDTQVPVVESRSERGILVSVMPMRRESSMFMRGNFIGVMELNEANSRLSMLYHNSSGRTIFQEEIIYPFSESSFKSNDYPLLAVETEPADCTRGFLSLDILRSLLSRDIMAYQEPGLYIIPQISLSDMCSAQSLERVDGIIAGELISDTDAADTSQFLIITWWQQIRKATYNLMATTTITDLKLISRHVYSFTLNLNDGLNVTAGNVLGIGIDTQIFSLYYDASRTGIMNRRVLDGFDFLDSSGIPITANVSMDIIRGAPLLSFGDRDSSLNFRDNCIKRLPRTDDIYLKILLVQSLIYTPMDTTLGPSTINDNGYVYLFNSNPFNTSGSITSWVFAARKLKTAISNSSPNRASQFPQLQIWRPGSMSVDGAISYYVRHFTTMIKSRPRILPGALNMYNVTQLEVDSPANYEQNDIIGIYQPSAANAALQIAFVNSDDTLLQALVQPTTLESTEKVTNEEQMYSSITVLPLMTLATKTAQTDSSTSSVPITSSIIDSTTPSTNANPSISSSRLDNRAIIGIAVGVLGSIALVMFIVILLLALYIAKKKNNRKKFIVQNNLPLAPIANDQALGNPTYTGASSLGVGNTNHTGGPTPITAGEEYEVPVVTLRQAGSQGAVYQDTSQPYETLGMTTSRSNEQWHMENHIYHVLETSTENQEGQTDEVEIYVPAGDHRRVLSSLTPADQQSFNMYATLTKSQFSTVRSDGSYFVESKEFWKPALDQEQLYHQLCANKYREIPRHNIKVTDKLGSGEFGEVSKGVWTKTRGTSVEVAVKTLRSDAVEGDRVSFLQEAAIMGQFRHPNIVTLMGVVTIGNPVMIVLELLVHGDLRSYLKQQKPIQLGKVSSGKLLNFCQHVAAGMDYLHKKGFIHRDLAARNILVASNSTCKISDFGLSRDLEEENYYVSKGGMIPVKWTAPEALNFKKFSPPCDVWSYGIVMYEIWSLGSKPYKRIKNMEVLPKVEGGYRLPPPPGCPREIYRIMIQCWHPEGSCRPTFSEVLDSLLQPESELLYWKSPISEDSGEDVHHHSTAVESDKSAILGAPLEAGEQFYPELQSTYMSVYEAAHVPLQ